MKVANRWMGALACGAVPIVIALVASCTSTVRTGGTSTQSGLGAGGMSASGSGAGTVSGSGTVSGVGGAPAPSCSVGSGSGGLNMPCVEGQDCGYGLVCVSGQCLGDLGSPCSQGCQCAHGLCVASSQVCSQTCASATDCPQGPLWSCSGGVCQCASTGVDSCLPGGSSTSTAGSTSGASGSSGGVSSSGMVDSGPPANTCAPYDAGAPTPGVYTSAGQSGVSCQGWLNVLYKREDAENRCVIVTLGGPPGNDGIAAVSSVVITNSAADCAGGPPMGQMVDATCGIGTYGPDPNLVCPAMTFCEGTTYGYAFDAVFQFPPTYSWVPATDDVSAVFDIFTDCG